MSNSAISLDYERCCESWMVNSLSIICEIHLRECNEGIGFFLYQWYGDNHYRLGD